MPYYVRDIVFDGHDQNRRIVGLRLLDKSLITIETAIALVRFHKARFLRWSDNGWLDVNVVTRNVVVADLIC